MQNKSALNKENMADRITLLSKDRSSQQAVVSKTMKNLRKQRPEEKGKKQVVQSQVEKEF